MAPRNPFNDDLWGHHPLSDRYKERRDSGLTPLGQFLGKRELSLPGWEGVLAKCESPIEKLMCRLLRDALGAIPHAGEYELSGLIQIAEKSPLSSLIVAYAQQEVGRYRADFLLVCYDKEDERPRLFIIECDGKEFHQDKFADAERDMFFIGLGIGVLRFTGAEIYEGAPDLGARVATALAMGA